MSPVLPKVNLCAEAYAASSPLLCLSEDRVVSPAFVGKLEIHLQWVGYWCSSR